MRSPSPLEFATSNHNRHLLFLFCFKQLLGKGEPKPVVESQQRRKLACLFLLSQAILSFGGLLINYPKNKGIASKYQEGPCFRWVV